MELLKTPLYEEHKRLKARMVPFAGFEMPVQYTGVIEEHTAVREKAGLFDVSHMGEIEISGERALEAVELLTTNNATSIKNNQCQYSILCNPEGGAVDDIIIYRFNEHKFMFCVNGSNAAKALLWIQKMAAKFTTVKDLSSSYGQIAIQGPLSEKILSKALGMDLSGLKYFRFMTTAAKPFTSEAIISRTGYTGEDGFEIYLSTADTPMLWRLLLETGSPMGLMPCGLGARDTLRLEAALPLYGNELDEVTTPVEAGLTRFIDINKHGFVGRDKLSKQIAEGPGKKLVAIEMIEDGIPRTGYRVLTKDGSPCGKITSGTFSPTLKKAIALAYVSADEAAIGTKLAIEIRGKAKAATVCKLPFYKRAKAV
ncbi:MAG: glycine cleavage system aminomethyltransferase GcvT [Deltaproteobacteria bacterium]|nr:glycine cleavage system aminomethyltransferase GcvT [Deltaproteobacteria bacterium]